jgi:flavin-dependent dehydrogenase
VRATQRTDVAIMGGGLAGLTLALQLRKTLGDDSDIVVVERNHHPAPAASHKVGESTVEIGSYYLANMLGMREHLESRHLPKFGLRLFFGSEALDGDISRFDELGASSVLPVRSYQIDRGILENHLGQAAADAGIRVEQGCKVTGVELSENNGLHELTFADGNSETRLASRWVVDACGRAGPLRARLGIAERSEHANHAVWFRLDARIKVDDWSSDANWQGRCDSGRRWLSTNHFMGPGYWVWLIPLGSGCTSVGIVADPSIHPSSCFPDFDATMNWLRMFQPTCWKAIDEVKESLMDFRYLRRYSHGARQVFSANRWAMTGDAGVFIDPFYSPGSDFIAISNSLVTELIRSDTQGRLSAPRCSSMQELYFSFYRSTLDLYLGQYPGFGDLGLMACKTTWDYAYYWSVLARLFCSGAISDPRLLATAGGSLLRARSMNQQIQRQFRERAALRRQDPASGKFVDQRKIPCLWNLNAALEQPISPDGLASEMDANVAMLGNLSEVLGSVLGGASAALGEERERELIGDLRQRLAA